MRDIFPHLVIRVRNISFVFRAAAKRDRDFRAYIHTGARKFAVVACPLELYRKAWGELYGVCAMPPPRRSNVFSMSV